MNVFAHSKMQFNIVRPNVRGRVLRLVSATGGLIGLLVYPASHTNVFYYFLSDMSDALVR